MSSLRLALKLSMESNSGQPPREESGKRKRSSDGSNDKSLKKEAIGPFDELNTVLKGKRKKRAKDASIPSTEENHAEMDEATDHGSASEDLQDQHPSSPLRSGPEEDKSAPAFSEAEEDHSNERNNETSLVSQMTPRATDGSDEVVEDLPSDGEGERQTEIALDSAAAKEESSTSKVTAEAATSGDPSSAVERDVADVDGNIVMSSTEAHRSADETRTTDENASADHVEGNDQYTCEVHDGFETLDNSTSSEVDGVDVLSPAETTSAAEENSMPDNYGITDPLSAVDAIPKPQKSNCASNLAADDIPGSADDTRNADGLNATENIGATSDISAVDGQEYFDKPRDIGGPDAVDSPAAADKVRTFDAVAAPLALDSRNTADEVQDAVVEQSSVEIVVKEEEEVDAALPKDPEGSAEKRQRNRSKISKAVPPLSNAYREMELPSDDIATLSEDGAQSLDINEEGENEHEGTAEESDRVESKRKRPNRQLKKPMEEAAPLTEDEAPRVSLRAAALIAKTKLMQRVASKDEATGTSGQSEKLRRSNSVAERSSSAAERSSSVGDMKAEVAAGKSEGSVDPEEESKAQWVQCDKCEKWRKLPGHINPDSLPDVWECKLATWCSIRFPLALL